MAAYFQEADERITFLEELYAAGRETEALTLCATYVDSFAQWLYWPRSESGRNFVEALGAYEATPYFSLAHPLHAVRIFRAMNGYWPTLAEIIEGEFPGPEYNLLDLSAFEARIAPQVVESQRIQVGHNLWRSTIGSVAYHWIRNPSVHGFGTSSSLSFGNTMLGSVPAPSMTLHILLPPLRA
ncbi:MAG: hypothetical protein Q8K82_08800, partial [Gemmatimonadaceae bacterium]|nr:hypothetical protein [Gemmatimonadaceae bacterium]